MAGKKDIIRSCPICAGRTHNFAASFFGPQLLFCSRCTGHFAQEPGEISYPATYFSESKPTPVHFLARPLLRLFLRRKTAKIKTLCGSGPILDYGAGDGQLVAALREEGVDAVGFDPSPAAVELAARRAVPVLPELPQRDFKLIMFWHSLEHTDEPLAVVERLKKILRPGGKLLIAVPNAASWEAYLAKNKWFHYDYPFHRIQFTPLALRLMLEEAGFTVNAIDFFTPEYNIAGLSQTFLNLFLPQNALYAAVTHRRISFSLAKLVMLASLSLTLIVLFSPFLAAFFLAALIFRKTGAMVIFAERRQ